MCGKCGERVVRRLAGRVKYAVGPERVEPIILGCMPSDVLNPEVSASAGLTHLSERGEETRVRSEPAASAGSALATPEQTAARALDETHTRISNRTGLSSCFAKTG